MLLEIIDTADVAAVVGQARAVLDCEASVRKVDRGHSDRTVVILSSPLHKGYGLLDLAVRLRALDGVVGVELGS